MVLPIESITLEARGLRFPALACGEGPLVLCLHGFPDTHHSFRHLLPALAAAGYRGVAPALRGYDPACLPALSACNALEVARDAVALIRTLGETQAHLVGHDWGAVAAYLAGAMSPASFRSITTLAVPHPLGLMSNLHRLPRQARYSWYMLFFQLRGLAERAVAARDYAFLEQLWRSWSPGYQASAEELHTLKQAFAQPGVLGATLAYYRAMFALRSPANFQARVLLRYRIEVPVLALTGADDGCIDSGMYDLAMNKRWFSELVVERVHAVGHFLHLEAPSRVNASILDWIRTHA